MQEEIAPDLQDPKRYSQMVLPGSTISRNSNTWLFVAGKMKLGRLAR
jgi:hypothetical protein